jgi:hypothetical protein
MLKMSFEKQAQDYHSKTPLIILGSGASAAYGMPGMYALAAYLIQNVDISEYVHTEDEQRWRQFSDLLGEGVDLETALHQVNLSENLTAEVIKATWSLINSKDAEIFEQHLQGEINFALSKLLSHLFNTSNKVVDILTTNYDRLAEYACDWMGLYHYSGFSSGSFRRLVPENYLISHRRVNIWKVHGSIDWFRVPEKEIIALPLRSSIPESYEPQIVTPGTQKYQRTHLPPYRDIIKNADEAITRASSYLCVGYGFNDEHIQPKLMEKCSRYNAPITVITHKLSHAAKKQIVNGDLAHYLAIECGDHENQSVVYSSILENPITIEKDCWSFEGYLKLIM